MDSPLLVGASASVQLLASDVELAIRCGANVLITGSAGVDRAEVARLLHAPGDQLGLQGSNLGALAAEGGTLFVDGVELLTPDDQAALLYAMERHAGTGTMRVIAASDGSLPQRVAAGSFREDLFYRLNVIHISVPPLIERRDDIVAMLNHCLRIAAERSGGEVPRLAPDATAALERYGWPGNVAELRSLAERLVAAGAATVTIAELPGEMLRPEAPARARGDLAHAQPDRVIVRVVEDTSEAEERPAPRMTQAR